MPADQKPRRCSLRWFWLAAVAVDSSIVTCAATALCQPRRSSSRFICIPYTALRMPSNVAAPKADAPVPPPDTTPMNANWEPPVNMSALSAIVCPMLKPAATARAPNERPYKPVATAMERPVLTAGECHRLMRVSDAERPAVYLLLSALSPHSHGSRLAAQTPCLRIGERPGLHIAGRVLRMRWLSAWRAQSCRRCLRVR